jgi:hypothetical protein
MPNFNLGALAKEAAKMKFRGFNLTLPSGPQRPPLFTLSGQMVHQTQPVKPIIGGHRAPFVPATPMASPPALFRAASSTKDDVDYQKSMHELYSGLLDSLLDAIEFGLNSWRTSAGLLDVRINGPIATGGRAQGPPIDTLITSAPAVAGWSNRSGAIRDAVAKGMEQQWAAMARSTSVPGLPWFPAFAAIPSPQAPPMPNVPTPFSALQQDGGAMSPNTLQTAIRGAMQGNFEFSAQFFESLATGLQQPLQIWKSSQMVTGVLGSGSVPTFAPPYVPVGPVVNGLIIPGPHFNT